MRACTKDSPPYVVAESYELSRATVSQIGGCRDDERRPIIMEVGGHAETLHAINITRRRTEDRKPRYQAVAREFDRLGEAEFLARYFTPAVRAKVGRVKPRSRAYDPTDTNHNGLCHDGEGYVTINLIEGQGWAYFDCDENGENLSGPYLNDQQKYFRTDRAAWEHLNAAAKNNLKPVDKD